MTASVDHPAIVEAYAELCAWLRALGEPQSDDAAAEIERLQARVKELEDGLQKIRRDDLGASDDEECPLCGGIGELEAYVEGTSRQTDYVGCPECLVRHHNEIARAVLQSSGGK